MENCPDTTELLRWINGSLSESSAQKTNVHVADCQQCQQRLEELTADESLQPPAGPDALGGPTFTNEPDFRSLQKTLAGKTKQLRRDHLDRGGFNSSDRADTPDLDGSQDTISFSESVPKIETTAMKFDPTSVLDREGEPKKPKVDADTSQTVEIEGFQLEGLIGRGGFAHVFQGWDKTLQRTVAIKVLDRDRIDSRNRHRFLREAKTAGSIQSPHVVRVLTSGETASGRPYIVMELVQGVSLATWIGQQTANGKTPNALGLRQDRIGCSSTDPDLPGSPSSA